MTEVDCRITVVMCTYNRAERLERAVQAVLAQKDCEFELVVVDDGSTDATPKVLASIDDDRVRVIRRPNGGLGVARNTGLEAVRGQWTVFLDDDDLPEPGWLDTLARPMSAGEVGVACCGVTFVDEDGRELGRVKPGPLGEPFGDAVGSHFAGSFAARTDLLRRVGGYLAGLGISHQTELFIRLLAVTRAEGLAMVCEDACALRITMRPVTHRPLRNPRRLYDGTRWILARYPEQLAAQRTVLGHFEGIVGTTGARLGEWQAARRHFLRAACAVPTSWKGWARLALATVPVVGRRVWNGHQRFATHDPDEIGVRRQRLDDVATVERELFLAWTYRENSPNVKSKAQRQTATQQLGSRLARKHGWNPVLDLSRIDGDVNEYDPHGDTDNNATRETRADDPPGLIICANLIERVDNPVELLHHLTRVSCGRPVLLSTADRERRDPDRPLGPPSNPDHRREWTLDQFELLLLSTGFTIKRTWLLPRRWYMPQQPIRRALRRPREPDPDATIAFLVRSRLP